MRPGGVDHGTAVRGKGDLPPFAQQLIERGRLDGIREGKLDGIREGELKGKLDGIREGKLDGIRDAHALLRLLARAGIALTEDERARIQACTEVATLERWVDNVLGAKTAADVLS